MFRQFAPLFLAGSAVAVALALGGCTDVLRPPGDPNPYYGGADVSDRGGPGWGGVWREPQPSDWDYHRYGGNGGAGDGGHANGGHR